MAVTCPRLGRNFSAQEWEVHLPERPYPSTCPAPVPAHPSLSTAALERAEAGDVDGALELFQTIWRHEHTADLVDGVDGARRQAAPALVVRSDRRARAGDIGGAIRDLELAGEWAPDLRISAETHNTMCWYGALWGEATAILDHCNRALELEPDNPGMKDSRGLALALTGRLEEATRDFRAYIDEARVADAQKDLRRS